MSTVSEAVIRCATCGGSLPLEVEVCRYCGTRYDSDLNRLQHIVEAQPSELRRCPHCKDVLQTINIRHSEVFNIERCVRCYGIFFDSRELTIFLDLIAAGNNETDLRRINELLIENSCVAARPIYLPCPACSAQMARKNFGSRTGIILDVCSAHGTWLDAGELATLVRWARLGGKHGDCPLKKEKRRLKAELEALDAEKRRVTRGRSDDTDFW